MTLFPENSTVTILTEETEETQHIRVEDTFQDPSVKCEALHKGCWVPTEAEACRTLTFKTNSCTQQEEETEKTESTKPGRALHLG